MADSDKKQLVRGQATFETEVQKLKLADYLLSVEASYFQKGITWNTKEQQIAIL